MIDYATLDSAIGHNWYDLDPDLQARVRRDCPPEDFEWAAGRVPGVRAGRCVAFSDDGGEGVVLLVEPRASADPTAQLWTMRRTVAT